MKKRDLIPLITGIIFLIFGIGAIINFIFLKNYSLILWICYPSLILLGTGFLFKNRILITSQLNILTIPLLIWTLDFIYFFITKNSLLGISDYFFNQYFWTSKIITSQHLFTVPLSFYSLKYIPGKARNSWRISIAMITLIFILSRTITSFEENINFAYSFFGFKISFYPLIWFFITSTLIIFTNYIIEKLNFKP